MYIRASMNVSSEQPAYFRILTAPPSRVRQKRRRVSPGARGTPRTLQQGAMARYACACSSALMTRAREAVCACDACATPARDVNTPRVRRGATEMLSWEGPHAGLGAGDADGTGPQDSSSR